MIDYEETADNITAVMAGFRQRHNAVACWVNSDAGCVSAVGEHSILERHPDLFEVGTRLDELAREEKGCQEQDSGDFALLACSADGQFVIHAMLAKGRADERTRRELEACARLVSQIAGLPTQPHLTR